MQIRRVRTVLAILCVLLAVTGVLLAGWAFGEGLFDFSRLPEEKHEEQQEAFKKALQGWKSETLDNVGLRYSSDTNVYFTGQSFVDLVHLGPAAVPYLVEALQKEAFGNSFLDGALSYLMGGSWRRLAQVMINQRSNSPIDAGTVAQATHWWKDVSRQCVLAWEARRSVFDERVRKGKPTADDLMDLAKEREWMRLRAMGLYAVPSVIKRLQNGTSDVYDVYLLNIWTAPFEVESKALPKRTTGGVEESAPSPTRKRVLPGDYNTDTTYWLRWWEENKDDYWWLMPK